MSILSRSLTRPPRTDWEGWSPPGVHRGWEPGELAELKADLADRVVVESVDFTPEQSTIVDGLSGDALVAFLNGLFDPPPWDALADPIDVTEPAALFEALACPAVHPDGLACERPRLDRFGQTHRSGHAAAPGVDLLDGRPVVTWRAKPVTG